MFISVDGHGRFWGFAAFKDTTSIPCVPKTPACQKKYRYFDLKYPKVCIYLNISYICLYIMFHGYFRTPEPFLLENYVYIVALTFDLQMVYFHNITGFFYYSSTTELILSLIFIKTNLI